MVMTRFTPHDAAGASYARTADEAIAHVIAITGFAAAHAAALDGNGTFPEEEFAQLREAGLLVAPLPRAFGGLGLGSEPEGTAPLLRLLTHLGQGNLAVGRIYEGHVNALALVHLFGTPAQMDRFAGDAHVGHRFAVWNAGEADDVRLIPAADGSVRLTGAKTFCSGAGVVTRPIITGALPDGGWQMVIVPMEQVQVHPDLGWWQVSGMRASVSAKVDFTGAIVPRNYVLGAPGDYYRQPWFSGGAIRFAAVQLGGAQALFDGTRRYLQELGRTTDPYQVQRAADMTIAIEGARLWLEHAAALVDDPASTPDAIVTYANLTRTVVERACMTVIQTTERAIGARGLLAPQPMERIIRDLTIYLRQPAPDYALALAGQYALDTAPYFDLHASREVGT